MRPISKLRRHPARAGSLAILALALAWGVQMHSMGWAQSANYAQVRALADGRAEIDRWHWETKDKAYVDGHFYSVKAPGLAALSTPLYLGLDAVGGTELAAAAADNAAGTDHPRWIGGAVPPYAEYGYSQARALAIEEQVIEGAPMIWALTLLGAVLPATLLLFLVRSVAERFEPGYGTAAAIILGLATIVMTFASEFFPHVIAAALGFAAFAVLLRERDGPPRVALAAGAGLLAGLAVSFEYQLLLVGVILFGYLLTGPRRTARGAAYAAGAIAGAVPALLFNAWALGSPFRFAYADAVATQGLDGHLEMGLNDDGLFGVMLPNVGSAIDLLIANRGLVTLTPVVVMAVVGVVMMRRRGHRAESSVILAVAAAYFLYNAGYWLPFGGGSPGPRFLIPALPFVAVGLATAYRRLPAATLALAIPSAVFMVAAAATFPLIGDNGPGTWANRIAKGNLEHTVLSVLGVASGWVAAIPLLLALAGAVALAVAATPRLPLGSARPAALALAGWVVIATFGPVLAGSPVSPVAGDPSALGLIAFGACASGVVLASLRQRAGGEGRGIEDWAGESATTASIS